MKKWYETSFDASGNIHARFWSDSKVSNWDFFMELDAKCRAKFPTAVLIEITRRPYVGIPGRVWWEMSWLKKEKGI